MASRDLPGQLLSLPVEQGRGPRRGDGMPLDETPTHIGHKAWRQRLLEHCIPVHVGQVGGALNITEAGQAALGVLGQELWAEGKHACLSCAPHRGAQG